MFVRSVSYKEKERILLGALNKAKPLVSKESFLGSGTAPFVGRFGYPKVNVGILAPTMIDEHAAEYDDPRLWAHRNEQIAQIVDHRTNLINSRFTSDVKKPSRLVELAQEIAMAKEPIDIEVSLTKRPSINISTNQWTAPMGPQGNIKTASLQSTPKIPTKVQRYFDDTDVKAVDALTDIYSETIDENSLSRMLSIGIFGKERKLVPTRWSITAVDDILAKDMLEDVRKLQVGDYHSYFGSYLGNYYLVLCFPSNWSYELFEMYVQPNMLEFSTDSEPFEGRKTYAKNCAGGYYSVKFAIAEHLKKTKRQQSILALRFITDEYVLPLGVWVTREATRKALNNKPISFASEELMLTYARHLAKKKFGIDLSEILKRSETMKKEKSNLKKWF